MAGNGSFLLPDLAASIAGYDSIVLQDLAARWQVMTPFFILGSGRQVPYRQWLLFIAWSCRRVAGSDSFFNARRDRQVSDKSVPTYGTSISDPNHPIFISGAGRQVALDDQLRQDFAYKVP